jgi:hypothetical protein
MTLRLATALLLLIPLCGCLKKAAYVPDGRGGYVLTTQTDSLDKAMIRFQRTASDLCPAGSYAFGEPAVAKDVQPRTYEIDVDCTAP